MTQPPNVSVIIPNLHSPHLGDLLTALAQQTRPPDQVIVVGQDRYGFVAQHPPSAWLQWISTPRPVSPALARNIGIAHARGNVLCFIDADCIPAPDWLERLLAEYQHGRQVVIGAVAIGGADESFWQRCDNILALGEYLQTAPAGVRAYLYTANVALARELFRTVGLFDLRYQRAAGEDTDLALRLRPHTPLYFTPAALVQHRTNRTTARAVWQHLWGYGQQWAALHDYGAAGLHRSLWQRIARVAPALAWLLVPVLVLRDVARLYRLQPALLRRYPLTAAVVTLLRGASYHGQFAYWHNRSKPHA